MDYLLPPPPPEFSIFVSFLLVLTKLNSLLRKERASNQSISARNRANLYLLWPKISSSRVALF